MKKWMLSLPLCLALCGCGMLLERSYSSVEPYANRYWDSGAEDTLLVSADVEISPTFLSWVLCFGGQVKILEPASAQQSLQQLAGEALARYQD